VYSDALWQNQVGQAQVVCLDASRWNCYDNPLIYGYNPSLPAWGGADLYTTVFANAHWIWIPGITPTTVEDGTKYYFRKTFTLASVPSQATIAMMVSGASGYYSSIYLNGQLLQSKQGVYATTPWVSPNIASKLVTGTNHLDFELRSQNCDPDCTYQTTPIGFIVSNPVTWQ
jgi:hypothetical protein